jgi:hypothetical protein
MFQNINTTSTESQQAYLVFEIGSVMRSVFRKYASYEASEIAIERMQLKAS